MMKLFVLLATLLSGTAIATTMQSQQNNADLEARVKAIEDFLAQPDSTCTSACDTTANECASNCFEKYGNSEISQQARDNCTNDCKAANGKCIPECPKSFPPK